MIRIFMALFTNYTQNAISFVTDTTYLNWNTSFPAITVCQISGTEFSADDYDSLENEDSAAMELFMTDLLFFTGSCYSCSGQCATCSKFNFTNLVEKYRKPCHKLLKTCKWNGVPFECCKKMVPLETEYGICFSVNSIHTRKTEESDINLVMNRKTGPGQITLETLEDVRVYYHAPEDVPFINSDSNLRKDVLLGEKYNVSLSVMEIDNDENVKKLSVEQRKCRFPWEKPEFLRVHQYYSYSSCIVQCHVDNHLRLCNCTHHLMPVYNKEKYCDIEGLKCLTNNFETVNRLHAKGFDKPGLVCDCLPSCVEPEYKVISETKDSGFSYGEINVRIQAFPTSRFKRIVVRSTMDLVVSIGGAAGLFIGASLLSIIEFVYLIFVRRSG